MESELSAFWGRINLSSIEYKLTDLFEMVRGCSTWANNSASEEKFLYAGLWPLKQKWQAKEEIDRSEEEQPI